MASTFGWVDYDARERESMTRILALFRLKESRDELGLGAIRDAIADQLFPGTSTIQTRLRYMLFVPWIYRALEEKGVTAERVASQARRMEVELIEPLLDEGEAGVLGRLARGGLKRLPSSVYWAALSSWGLFMQPGMSQEDYHAAFDDLRTKQRAARRRDDFDLDEAPRYTWSPGIPEPPATFPKQASCVLRRCEAEYLRARICERHPVSLLAWLAQQTEAPPDWVGYIWEHPRLNEFPEGMRKLTGHARVFANVMNGAAILYNLELARKRDWEEKRLEHHEALGRWVAQMVEMRALLDEHSFDEFWALVEGRGHNISLSTRWFVEAWFQVTRAGSLDVADGAAARDLVRRRERSLKRSQSRFDNRRALDQWTGAAGLGVATFRWPVTQGLLRDLWDGLASEED